MTSQSMDQMLFGVQNGFVVGKQQKSVHQLLLRDRSCSYLKRWCIPNAQTEQAASSPSSAKRPPSGRITSLFTAISQVTVALDARQQPVFKSQQPSFRVPRHVGLQLPGPRLREVGPGDASRKSCSKQLRVT